MVARVHNQAAHGRGEPTMPKLNVEKSPARKHRKSTTAPVYTRKPAEPCPFIGAPVPTAVAVNLPAFVAGTGRTIGGVDYTVALYSDDSVRITTDGAPAAHGRFVALSCRTDYGVSVDARIVDVNPEVVSADVVQALSSDLTYFAFRAGRFAGVR